MPSANKRAKENPRSPIRICDQLFNSSEKRLARALVKPARVSKYADLPKSTIPH
jgi:hypothetical protein